MSEFQKESLSLEETNKVRISLGLKPLVDDSASAKKDKDGGAEEAPKDKDQIAEENYKKRREQEAKAKEDEEIRQRIAKAQNKRQLRRQLRGPTLGDEDPSTSSAPGPSDSKSTVKWLRQAQKKAKEHAERRAKELEEQEAAATYGEADLAGLRVAHDMDDFDLQEGDEGRILTLRDSRILDGDEDELMDSALEQKELDRRNELRKKGPKQYTGIDDEDEMTSAALGKKQGVLSKYDADIPEGQRRDRAIIGDSDGGFRLGGSTETNAERKAKKQRELEEEARKANRSLLSLDYSKNQEVSDYLAPGDVGFKKSKGKKKKRPAASKIKLDDDEEDAQQQSASADVEMEPIVHARRQAEKRDNLVDDDELAASLAKARRAKAKKAISKMTPEEIAKNLAAQKAAEEAAERKGGVDATGDFNMAVTGSHGEAAPADAPGMTFDETSEFIRNIGNRPASPEQRRSRSRGVSVKREPSEPAPAQGVDADSLLSTTAVPAIKREPGEDDDELMEGAEDLDGEGHSATSPTPRDATSGSPDPGLGTAAERLVSNGLAGTLGMLRSQGILESMTPEQRRREAEQRSYDAWKAKRQAEEALREHERHMSKLQGSAKDQATREYENKMRELEEAKRAEERFKDYKPDIDIKYHDEHGRVLNNHEAWKLLSHTFHGKMPGRAKQEKAKQRIEEERKKERMAAGEAQDMSKAFRDRQAREGQAHMVLSVGARGNAPQEFADSIGPNLVQQRANKRAQQSGGASGSAAGPSGFRPGESSKGMASVVPRQVGGATSSLRATPSEAGMRSLRPPGFNVIEGDGAGASGSQSPSGSAAPPGFRSAAGLTSGSSSFSPVPPPVQTTSSSATKSGFQPVDAAPAAPSSSANGGGASTTNGIGGGFKLSLGTKRKADEQGGRQ
ncbi:hypothetical protein BDZ90DRAFT_257546 [Jaminaea rosea]|uniref:SART-1 protein n=1 Tax=Jaminaea rosea TaxID=1569628 RepID=A0A316UZQ6_9BASI|nr:hypothetical protein BDZ90DRAFT_257546 [Jaminaea rosea]PWN30464.1 hypothetical protein BDZ90DRAFT_257546 [Jaminaea rosea]